MSASIGLSAASEKGREFPAFSTRRGNAFCLPHVGDARHVGDGGYSPCLFGYVTMWVGASQSDARQPIRTSVSENKEAVYRPISGASLDEEQTKPASARCFLTAMCSIQDSHACATRYIVYRQEEAGGLAFQNIGVLSRPQCKICDCNQKADT